MEYLIRVLISNAKCQMSNQIQNSNIKKKYDLSERTSKFGEEVIDFAKEIVDSIINKPLINQFIRSGTSVGANYMEADAASTKRDFRHKISICRKEAKETRHWLRMVVRALPEKAADARVLWKEAQELVLIFSAILK